ncbi:MAG: EAL domain-containing protein [Butyrivibrio sp.]|nr:EAL domain-containing protein [Butyrivibrio sp.]
MAIDKQKILDIEKRYEHDFRRSILIVDDEPVNLRILGKILADEYDMVYAQTGREAMDLIRAQSEFLSLVLLDLHMPDGDGYSVLKEVCGDEDLKRIPIIVITSDKQAEVESLRMGAVDFLSKPYDNPEVIKARVSRALELAIRKDIINATGYDSLTGLMTKEYFYQYCLEYDKFHPDREVDAIVVNFSRFHLINDLYGRSFGDKVLCAIAEGVRTAARACNGVACRYSADRFYLYIEHRDTYDFLVRTLSKELKKVMNTSEMRLKIGVYSDLYQSANFEQRFARALQASNSISKNNHSASVAMYNRKMHEKELYEGRLLEDVDTAIKEGQFSVAFQPKYDIRSDFPRIAGAEVLVRWKHPSFGQIKPDYFVPLLEEHGRINELDRFVWQEAARQVRTWKDMYGLSIPISVNVSRVDIFDPELKHFLLKMISDNELDTSDIHLEITETAYTESTMQIIDVVKDLQDEEFLVEMDDFGKGYSSLNMLTSLPIDALKLDMAFIQGIAEGSKEMRMVEFVLRIADFLQVPVIAEGVETSEQYLLLKKAGCDIIQGYYFSKPVPPGEFGCLIEKNLWRAGL